MQAAHQETKEPTPSQGEVDPYVVDEANKVSFKTIFGTNEVDAHGGLGMQFVRYNTIAVASMWRMVGIVGISLIAVLTLIMGHWALTLAACGALHLWLSWYPSSYGEIRLRKKLFEYDDIHNEKPGRLRYTRWLSANLKAKFGLLADTAANRMILRDETIKMMHERGVRPSHQLMHLPLAIEMALIPTPYDLHAKLVANQKMVRGWKTWVKNLVP